MSLLPNAGSENSLVWQAMDASDGDPQPEQLAVRFKLAGTTQRFKTTFEDCQAELRKTVTDNAETEQGEFLYKSDRGAPVSIHTKRTNNPKDYQTIPTND